MKKISYLPTKVKELESECILKLQEYGECIENDRSENAIIEENISCEYLGYILEDLLGVRVMKKIFCWEEDFLSHSCFKIGTREIDIVKGKSLDTLFGEIKTAIFVGLTTLEAQVQYLSCISNDDGLGIGYQISQEYIEQTSIKEIIQWINSKTYCDEEFEETIRELGFEIYEGNNDELGNTKYIDVSCFVKGAKIWLEEGFSQHTMYRWVSPRARVEVLYLLNALKYRENIFSDEY